jgi:hypothetical protein
MPRVHPVGDTLVLGYEAPADAVNRAREYLVSVFDNKDANVRRPQFCGV